jgi:hypothetical protein
MFVTSILNPLHINVKCFLKKKERNFIFGRKPGNLTNKLIKFKYKMNKFHF